MEEAKSRFQEWSRFLMEIRSYFISLDYLEVTTPSLVPVGAFEASLDCLKVAWEGGSGELHTSPEIAMKALLSQVRCPIYQITKCFRDDPATPIHRREFTMLEFYEPQANYLHTIRRTRELFQCLSTEVLTFKEITVGQAFLDTCGLDLRSCSTEETLRAEITKRGLISCSPEDNWEDLYFKLLLEKVEPSFDPDTVTVLKDYPSSQAALARLNASGNIAERFEFYWKGIELCNGCTELGDREDLMRRYGQESEKRRKRGKKPHPIPQQLIDSIESMPPSSGVAVGLDRLFFCLTGFPLT